MFSEKEINDISLHEEAVKDETIKAKFIDNHDAARECLGAGHEIVKNPVAKMILKIVISLLASILNRIVDNAINNLNKA